MRHISTISPKLEQWSISTFNHHLTNIYLFMCQVSTSGQWSRQVVLQISCSGQTQSTFDPKRHSGTQ